MHDRGRRTCEGPRVFNKREAAVVTMPRPLFSAHLKYKETEEGPLYETDGAQSSPEWRARLSLSLDYFSGYTGCLKGSD